MPYGQKKSLRFRRDLLARSLYTSNYFFAAESTLTAAESTLVESTLVESTFTAAVSALAAVESALTSVEAPPQAANAAIAKIANTFFIWKGFNCLFIILIPKRIKSNPPPSKIFKKNII